MTLSRRSFLAPVAVAIGLLLSGCSKTYDFQMEYRCLKFNPVHAGADAAKQQHQCVQWEQSGGLSTPSCFPGDATVMTRTGPKAMADLRIGEEVLGFDHATHQSIFSPVRAWLHRYPEKEVLMKRIEGDRVSIVASGMHSLALQGTDEYEFASYLTPGKDVLLTEDGNGAKVRKVYNEYANGLFAPLTGTSNYYVGFGANRSVLAHSFAQIRNPRRFERVFHRLIDIAEFFTPTLNDVHTEAYVHPIAQILMDLLGYSVVDSPMIRRRLQTASGFEDIVVPFEGNTDDRRLSEPGGRRLYGDGGQQQQQEQLRVILFATVEALPPFLSNALTGVGSPMPVALPPTVNIQEWLDAATTFNRAYAIGMASISVCFICCYCCLAMVGGSSRESRDRESGSESLSEAEDE